MKTFEELFEEFKQIQYGGTYVTNSEEMRKTYKKGEHSWTISPKIY